MLGANLMWGLMSPLAKLVMLGGAVTPLVLTDLRIFGAMVLFWTVSFFRKPEHVPHKDMARLLGASLLAIVFNQGAFIFGVELTSPASASIIATSMPLWAMVLSAFFLHEPVTGRKVLGIAAGAGGALLLIMGSGGGNVAQGAAGSHPVLGDLLVLLAQLSYASYIVLFKDFVGRYSLVTIMKWMFTYAFIFTLPFSYRGLLAAGWGQLSAPDVARIAFIVVGATFGSYLLTVVGQKTLRPTVAGMYNYVQPVVATVVAVCLSLDTFNVVKALAVCLIFAGVWLVTASRSRQEMEAHRARQAGAASADAGAGSADAGAGPTDAGRP